jgi:broad specificity phosphatase PhoE
MKFAQSYSRSGTIYLLRHGDTRSDAVKRYIGWTDVPLSEFGRRQAFWWQKELSSFAFCRIICSDLERSAETAKIVGEGRNVTIEFCPDLREINLGKWDGLEMEKVRLQFPVEYEKRGINPAAFRPERGESFFDLSGRVVPAFEKITGSSCEGNILIVGHAGVNRVILCSLLEMPLSNLFRLGQDYGCLNVLSCGNNSLQIQSMNILPDVS